MSTRDESSPMSRFTGPGVPGEPESSGVGDVTRGTNEPTNDDINQDRPFYEKGCLAALENFRTGRINRVAASTRVALAIANTIIHDDVEEAEVLERYFTLLDRIENELRSTSSQTRADSTSTLKGKGKAQADTEDQQEEISERRGALGSGKRKRSPAVAGAFALSSSSDAPPRRQARSACNKRKRVKLNFKYLELASREIGGGQLSKPLQQANKLIENWSHDIKEVVRRYDLSPRRPEFPTSELKHILEGDFVNLDAVLTYHYSSQPCDKQTEKVGDLEFSFTRTTFARKVDSAAEWLTAWGRAERAYAFVFPFRGFEFRRYGEYISQTFTQHHPSFHDNVIRFDRAIRQRVASRNDLLFTDFAEFSDIHAHHILPSRIQYDPGRSNRLPALPKGRASCNQCDEPCRKWNQGTCKRSADSCKYKHVCAKCGKAHRDRDSECRGAA